ncbi:nitroreductase family protein [Fulvivirga sediminis]|uniref:Nitroreductase family protein n=1 Tax=Fulvivirga sediminis TaxID=2803949 RepID=A0A937JY10_9BACT|nr:nitroreductase family protein [Fulvivirga sediminis]MBL3655194.1 nitroreductase family protein [Fulvivirga sediminis]
MRINDAVDRVSETAKKSGYISTEDKVQEILESIRMAPTSMGVQPFQVFVIKDQELKGQLLPVTFDEKEIEDCSHLLVFAAWDKVTEARVKTFIDINIEVRNFTPEKLAPLGAKMEEYIKDTPENNFLWAARQAYLAFGVGLVAAVKANVKATPIESFKSEGLDKLLGLKELGLKSVAMMLLSDKIEKRDSVAAPKTGKSEEDLLIHV